VLLREVGRERRDWEEEKREERRGEERATERDYISF
jgi:hypothetical protein